MTEYDATRIVPKYPHVKVRIFTFSQGHPFPETVAEVQHAMRKAGVPEHELSNFYEEVADDDDENLLGDCMRWVNIVLK
jgi:hypothetical protein